MSSSFKPGELADFARYHGFHYDIIDPVQLVQEIRVDLERGLRGQSSSLPMIPTYISPIARVPAGRTVLALDAGGTNLRAARVRFDESGKAIAEGTRKAPMPGTKGQVTADQFFDQIAEIAAPLLDKSGNIEGIGFCFSYPMEVTKEADGILLAFSKEVDAPAVIGKSIGQGLRDALARCKVKAPEKIILLNDTVSTLLCGLVDIPVDGRREGPDKYGIPGGPMIGFILGTGFNTAYPEKSIPKIGFESETAPQIVVCETGGFMPRYLGYLDKEYDNTTKNPGTYAQEKASAGAYLGPLSFHILKQAVREGVLSFNRSDEFLAWPTLQTKDLNSFLRAPLAMEGPIGELFGKDERDALASFVYLCSIVTERGALLSAAILAATVERMDAGYDPFAPIRIAVEGTTYVRYKGMREALESYLHVMLNAGKPRSYVISPVEQASLFGAAVAALTE
ncbi:hexokinase [Treponema primitia ZAS-2]|uniref:Hexokinase n=1 Tax=Treponema primitia (strain ATCC BAA-887 / DSM 12427 / ZAS-2) TaxID=545694 RepID=F5YQU9_TREPZ|nr:hexokinase [Treponema primitia]AEF84644.1 hexokinase [Treponema primitia ZAS-2]